MSDNVRDTMQQDGGMTEGVVRSSGRGGAARRTGTTGSEGLRGNVAMGGEMARHLRDAPGTTTRRAKVADEHRSVAETATQDLQDLAMRMATVTQASAREMGMLFALRGFDGGHLQELRENVGTSVESVMRANARMMQELFRMTSPAAAIELQRRCATEYMDTMLHGSAMLARAAHRAADQALRPLEEHVAQRRKRHATHSDGYDDGLSRVADVMRTAPPVVSPEDTVQHAMQLMRESDLGGLPVRDGDRLTGMVTDRDIALRVVAEARDPTQTRVRDVMMPDVPFVFEDDAVAHVAEDMADQHLRRLPVLNREKRLVGVISLVDLARKDRRLPAGDAVTHAQTRAAE